MTACPMGVCPPEMEYHCTDWFTATGSQPHNGFLPWGIFTVQNFKPYLAECNSQVVDASVLKLILPVTSVLKLILLVN
jgi:hypothetical protein